MYVVDDVKKIVFVRNFKVASTSLLAALWYGCYAIDKEHAQYLQSYTWIIVCRHPFSRLASAWGMRERSDMFNEYPTFSEFVDSILSGSNTNVHITPQVDTLLKTPDLIYRYESLANDWEQLKLHFQAPDVLPQLRVNPTPVSWQELFSELSPTQIDQLREYYHRDFEMFGYD